MALHPPFAFSLFQRNPAHLGTLAFKVLNPQPTPATTPLVLIHGMSAVGLVDWLPLAAALARTRPVMIFDNRNIGSSSPPAPPPRNLTLQDFADDVVDLIKHVGWREVDVLGFSMGGMIAQTLALTPRLPFTIKHLVLAATSAKPPHSELLENLPAPSQTPPKTLQDKMEATAPFIHVGYDAKFIADPKNEQLLRQRILEAVSTKRPARTIAQQVEAISTYDVRSRLPLVPPTIPVLSIHGNLDRSVYVSEQKYILKGIPHARRLKTPSESYGHMWYDYFSIEFWEDRLRRFLDDDESVPVYAAGEASETKVGKL